MSIAEELGFEIAHVGVNMPSNEAAQETASRFNEILGAGIKDGNSSVFVGTGIEVMKSMYLGTCGHLAVRTNDMGRAIAYLEEKGFKVDMQTAKYKNDKLIAVYLEGEIGGFAVHLLQK